MANAWVALLLLTGRWLRELARAFVADLRAASAEAPASVPPLRAAGSPRAVAVEAGARVPLNRVLAFRGVQRRVAARRRWEAGFGRKGL